jgi:hypothetical protein
VPVVDVVKPQRGPVVTGRWRRRCALRDLSPLITLSDALFIDTLFFLPPLLVARHLEATNQGACLPCLFVKALGGRSSNFIGKSKHSCI